MQEKLESEFLFLDSEKGRNFINNTIESVDKKIEEFRKDMTANEETTNPFSADLVETESDSELRWFWDLEKLRKRNRSRILSMTVIQYSISLSSSSDCIQLLWRVFLLRNT